MPVATVVMTVLMVLCFNLMWVTRAAADGVRIPQLNPTLTRDLAKLRDAQVAAEDLPQFITETQSLLEKTLEESWHVSGPSVAVQFATYLPAHRVLRNILLQRANEWGEVYRQEYESVARANYRDICTSSRTLLQRAEAFRQLSWRYPLTHIGSRAALAAVELFLESGDIDRAAKIHDTLPLDSLPPFIPSESLPEEQLPEQDARSQWIQLGLLISALSGDRPAFSRYQRYNTQTLPRDSSLARLLDQRTRDNSAPSPPRLPLRRDGLRLLWPAGLPENLRSPATQRRTSFAPVAVGFGDSVVIASADNVHRFRLSDGAALAPGRFDWYRTYEELAQSWRYSVTCNGNHIISTYVDTVEHLQGRGRGGGVVRAPIPHRSVIAFAPSNDGESLATRWDTSGSNDPQVREFSFSSEPCLVGDRVYALGWRESGYVAAYLVAFDANNGRVVWSTLLGSNQIELTRFGELAEEPRLGKVVVDEGTLYVSTDLGWISAVSPHDGSIQWSCVYQPNAQADSIDIRRRRRYPFESTTYWDQTQFHFHGSRIVVNPKDSSFLLALDRESGRVLQRRSLSGVTRRPYFVVGSVDKDVIVCDRFSMQRIPVTNLNHPAPTLPLTGRLLSRPALVDGGIVYSNHEGIFFSSYTSDKDTRGTARDSSVRLHEFKQPTDRRGRSLPSALEGHVLIMGTRVILVNSTRVHCYQMSWVH